MFSFGKMYEQLEAERSALLGTGEDSKSVEAVRSGLNLKNEDFWEDFMTLCGNAESMSELLEVPKEKVSKWPSLIRAALNKVNRNDDEESKNKKSGVISTGDELADPNGIESPNNEPADTRPMP